MFRGIIKRNKWHGRFLFILTTVWIVFNAQPVFGQNSASDPQDSPAFDTPPLIPETLLDIAPITVDPSPAVEQPQLFPPESTNPREIPTKSVERAGVVVGAPNGTVLNDAFGGAASNFGFNEGTGSLMRPSIAGAQADRERNRIMARAERQANLEHYNVKIGPVPFRFGAGIEFQFSDNANQSKSNQVADLSIIPHIDMYGGLRLTSQNSLSIQLGIGYIFNLNRPELDRALTNASVGLDTDSGLSFDIKVGNFRINLYERPAIPRQQFDLITQRDPLQYSQFTNTAGVSVFWDVNSRLGASLQYSHTNVIALKSEVKDLNQVADQLAASANYRFSDALSFGIHASASYVQYERGFLNESKNYSAGMVITARTGRNTTVSVMAGYQGGAFGSGGGVEDSSQLGDWYARLEFAHNMNRVLGHSIAIGHESQLGTASNSTEIDYIRYQLNLNISRKLGFGTSMSYESATESGGLLAQEFKLFQAGVFGYWSISKKLSLNFSYRFISRDATGNESPEDESLDYVENRIDVGVQVNL